MQVYKILTSYILDLQACCYRHTCRAQDQGPLNKDEDFKTQHRGSRSEYKNEDCRSRKVDESKPRMTIHYNELQMYGAI